MREKLCWPQPRNSVWRCASWRVAVALLLGALLGGVCRPAPALAQDSTAPALAQDSTAPTLSSATGRAWAWWTVQ